MIRQAVNDQLEAREIDHDPHFQWRGRNVTRIENLSDIVFAIALGMLVSAAEPIINVADLKDHLLNIVPVIAGFAILLLIWNMHYVFFRRYGLSDGLIVFYNAILLLLILYIAYPLRFIFGSLFNWILSMFGYSDRIVAMGIDSFVRAGEVMSLYAVGYALIFAIFALMYRHVLSRAEVIGLSEKEIIYTRFSIWMFFLQIVVSLGVAVLASTPPAYVTASFLFILLWPGGFYLRARADRQVARLEAQDKPATSA